MHDFWEIIYVDKQEISVVKDSAGSLLRQGEIVFIKPNQPHYVRCGKEGANIFIISFECRSESMGFFFDKQYSVPDKYRYLLQNIMAEARETFIIPDFDPDLNKLELRENPNLGGEQVIKILWSSCSSICSAAQITATLSRNFLFQKSIPPQSFKMKS